MEKIDIDECHQILLDVAKDFHKICVKNGIPYYMLGGTMLGAIRHKGFIPWDDDMDFGIPRVFFDDFLEVCKKQLDKKYKLNTEKNTNYLCSEIIKISDTRTIIESNWTADGLEDCIGINIDIFPLDNIKINSYNREIYRAFRFIYQINGYKRYNLENRSFLKRIIARCIKAIPCINDKNTSRISKQILKVMMIGDSYANLYGAWGIKEWIPKDVFGNPTLYTFENTQFYGVTNYDAYLKNLYNNYMELPHANKRHIHLVNVYWR